MRAIHDGGAAHVREAVVTAYGSYGVQVVYAATHKALFAESGGWLDRDFETNPLGQLDRDLVIVDREEGNWIGVYSARWELAPQGRQPLAIHLSSRWPVLSVTSTEEVAYEVCRYEGGGPVQYAAHGQPSEPPPVDTCPTPCCRTSRQNAAARSVGHWLS